MFVTFKYRVKDRAAKKHLDDYARACNQVWNFCVATQRAAERKWEAGLNCRWPTAFDLINLNAGSSEILGIHSDTVSAICRQFATSRNGARHCPRFRASQGARRALGWIPIVPRAVRIDDDAAIYLKRRFRFWRSREIEGEFKSGAFVEDARGRWYVVFQCAVTENLPTGNGEVGIDLGLYAIATLSDGTSVPAIRPYRKYERALAVAQRAGKKRRASAICAKITNSRKHHLHEATTRIARENALIAVGDVNAAKLGQTRMAKSVRDASWSSFRHMLRYKAARRQAVYVEVDERWTSQTCSECGCIGGPQGLEGLGVRTWDCPACGASHDRDVNSARLILRSGRSAALQMTGNAPDSGVLALIDRARAVVIEARALS